MEWNFGKEKKDGLKGKQVWRRKKLGRKVQRKKEGCCRWCLLWRKNIFLLLSLSFLLFFSSFLLFLSLFFSSSLSLSKGQLIYFHHQSLMYPKMSLNFLLDINWILIMKCPSLKGLKSFIKKKRCNQLLFFLLIWCTFTFFCGWREEKERKSDKAFRSKKWKMKRNEH